MVLLMACADPTQPRVPTSIQLSQQEVQMEQGESVTLTATLLDQHGTAFTSPLEGYAITWTSSAPSIASVSDGSITGESAGQTIVTARAGSLPGAPVTVRVTRPAVAGVQLYTEGNVLLVGETRQLTAYVFDARGNVISDAEVTWTSLDPELATVSDTGLLTGQQPGWARIRLSIEGHSDAVGFHIRRPRCTGTPVGSIAPGESVSGALSTSDCDTPFTGPWPIATFAQAWRFELTTAATVQIDLTSTAFNAVLYLSDLNLNLIAYDQGSGEGMNARINRALQPGVYLIWASSYSPNETGAYQLSVR